MLKQNPFPLKPIQTNDIGMTEQYLKKLTLINHISGAVRAKLGHSYKYKL